MAWIESHQELGRHPKALKLTRLLKAEQPGTALPAVVGYLHFLWWWAMDFAQDGSLARYDAYEIAEAAQWNGDAQAFLDALIEAGFIDRKGDDLTLHDWDEYAGKLLERRAKDRERKRTAAEEAKRERGTPNNSDGKPTERGRTPSLPNLTQPNQHNQTKPNQHNPTLPNQTKPSAASAESLEQTFAAFWNEYPRKVGKTKCFDVWKKLKPSAELVEKIMAAVMAQKQTAQWQKDGGAYIPHPTTWLNQGRWDDEVPEVRHQEGGQNGRTSQDQPATTGFHEAD